jgi:hypothetical protein
MPDRPVNITFAQMRNSGVRGIIVYCCDYRCSHSNDVGLSQIEPRFVCTACGERGPDVRPAFHFGTSPDRSEERTTVGGCHRAAFI